MCDQHEGSRSRPLAEREGGMGGGREGGRDLREERSESRKGGAGGQGAGAAPRIRAYASQCLQVPIQGYRRVPRYVVEPAILWLATTVNTRLGQPEWRRGEKRPGRTAGKTQPCSSVGRCARARCAACMDSTIMTTQMKCHS